jgi:hypothetical protein
VCPGFLVGALSLQIRGDLDVSVEAVVAGVFFLAGALGAGPGGRLAERVGAAEAMRACVPVTAAWWIGIGRRRERQPGSASRASTWARRAVGGLRCDLRGRRICGRLGAAAGLALSGATVIAIAGRRVGLRASWR